MNQSEKRERSTTQEDRHGLASDSTLAEWPQWAPEYRSPTGISTATVLPGWASGQAHAGS